MNGKVIIITGATSGIGEATAHLFARQGARIVVAGRREEKGRAVVEKIKQSGGAAIYVRADMASDSDIKTMVETTLSTYGSLDLAFNNAGLFAAEPIFHEYKDEDWDAMIAVNLTGVYRCMKHEIKAMLETGAKSKSGAVIINNASTVGHRGSDRSGPGYTAAKHGVIGLTKQAAIAYVNQNIRVNAVSPGPTLTEVSEPLVTRGPEAVQALVGPLNPMARLIEADEVAQTVAFLCSDAASMITGHALPVDGGQLARL
ncbi:MAG: SDR family oxidoreductase [Proteobacteria bacterium]|nr:SDR family oxidoreductase [Pseudomonadota bacterium]